MNLFCLSLKDRLAGVHRLIAYGEVILILSSCYKELPGWNHFLLLLDHESDTNSEKNILLVEVILEVLSH